MRELKALSFARIINCHNGLVLLTSPYPVHRHIVVNPLSNKIVTRISPLFWGGYPCGIFFHPLAKEYRVLNVQKLMTNYYEYHLYLFGTKTWRKTNTPYFNSGPPDCYDSKQLLNCNPVIANGALHWYIGKIMIMIFDMITEGFCVKPLPFSGCYRNKAYWLGDLLVDEDRLCCFLYALSRTSNGCMDFGRLCKMVLDTKVHC
ncbi:hypothetical protein PHJA_001482700 [Phtheirospermum japonicum]|uniref:F-box associated beta-propeller type 1 domain-containing protein n=1 Tax=Phtheirospermum japonicum TaxID=374723 RepID=A0A830CBJ6_9LAMI|nr:hypothetical protein PHJA_001482700 [Phtheirospermum japonicum]